MQFLRGATPRARIVLTADHHLGNIASGISPTQVQIRAARSRQAFAAVAAYCAQNGVDALVIAGDLFDSPAPAPDDLRTVIRECRVLKTAGVTVAALAGDCDGPRDGGISPLSVLAELDLLVDLDALAGEPLLLKFGDVDVTISALSRDQYLSPTANPLNVLDRRVAAGFHFLVTHYAIEGMGQPPAPGPSINIDSVRSLLGVSVLVSGHVHTRSHGMAGDTVVAVPGGYDQSRALVGFLVMDVSRRGLEGVEAVELPVGRREEVTVQGAELELQDSMAHLQRRLEPFLSVDADVVLRITGKVKAEAYREAGLARLCRWASDRCASFDLDLSGLNVAPDQGEAPRRPASMLEEVRRVAAELAERGGLDGAAAREPVELAVSYLRRALVDPEG